LLSGEQVVCTRACYVQVIVFVDLVLAIGLVPRRRYVTAGTGAVFRYAGLAEKAGEEIVQRFAGGPVAAQPDGAGALEAHDVLSGGAGDLF
jgi:hypothetical protein